ncbi:MAG: response regulator [Promethearchaeota archaeon]
MKPLILVVEDNADILFSIKLILEANGFEAITAENGEKAINILNELRKPPEVIISDIMMPKMNGYDFFKTIFEDLRWNRIPFIFLSARSSPEDIRFGKMLGVDDYITKPFNEEDLIAIVSGKIARNKKNKSVNQKVEELLLSLNVESKASISEEEKNLVHLLIVIWDDRIGPELKDYYPKEEYLPIPIRDIGTQLFQATVSIYGNEDITEAEGLLLNIENIKKYGYILFDSYRDKTSRGGERQFMIAVIAPKINYFESFEIKEIFKNFSLKLKKNEKWDIKIYWEEISNVLSTPII